MKDLKWFLWFLYKSWSFLGCDNGTGRWEARRRYMRGVIPRGIGFVRSMR